MTGAIVYILLLAIILPGFAAQPVVHNDTGRVCNPGFFENGNVCQPCAEGTFRNNTNPFICLQCPPGTQQAALGKISCTLCQKDFFQPEFGKSTCISCPVNTFTNGKLGAAKCEPCPKGTFTGRVPKNFGDRCIRCDPGEFFTDAASLPSEPGVPSPEGAGRCKSCPRGTFTNAVGLRKCLICPQGQFPQSISGPCLLCKPGTFLPSIGAEKCELCPIGSYQPLSGASSCIPCPEGSTTSFAGATSCTANAACPAGNGFGASGIPTTKCVKCARGFASPSGSSTPCFQCFNGTIPTADGSGCKCPSNFQFLPITNPISCSPCPLGSFSSGLPGVECTCPPGQYLDLGRSRCACPPGQRYDGSKCTTCEPGLQPGQGDCDFCAAGSGLIGNSTRCQSCGPFAPRIPTFGACPRRSCPSDQFLAFRSLICQCREPGFVIRKKGEPCQKCPPGFGTTFRPRNTCVPCSQTFPTKQIFNGTACVPCNQNEEVFNNTCLPVCIPGRQRNQQTGKCECIGAPEINETQCGSCPVNQTFRSSIGQCACSFNFFKRADASCERCPGGTISREDGVCRPCGSLKFRPREQDFSCRDCKQGDPDEVQAEVCVPAKCMKTQFTGMNGACESCPTGTRLLNRKCVPCGENQISAGGRTAFCSICTAGTTANAGKSVCG